VHLRQWQEAQGESRRELALPLVLSLLLTTALLFGARFVVPGHPNYAKPWDHHKYIWMATDGPLDFHIAPFCWRILVPALAKALPFDLEWSFFLLAFAGVWMTGMVVYSLALRWFPSPSYGLVAMAMWVSLGWAGKLALRNFWLPDSLAFFFVALAVYAVLARRDALFVLSVALGVLAKESVFFVVPLYYTLRTDRWIDPGLLKRCALLALPAALLLVLVRVFIPALNEDPAYLSTLPETVRLVQEGSSSYGYLELFRSVGLERLRTISAWDLYAYSVGTFGVIVLLPLFALRRAGVLFLRFLPFLLLVYAQLLFAVNTERLLVLAFPAVILMALAGVEGLSERLSIGPGWFVWLALALVVVNAVFPGYFSGAQLTAQIVVLVVFLAAGCIVRIVERGGLRGSAESK
jgi:hypothetical protein